MHEKPENNTNANTASPPEDSPASTASPDKKQESSESLASHRLRGAIRALAAITKAPGNGQVREAIGDSRLLTRRLAQLVRVRVPMSGAESANATLRDEPLAANVCLIFEACVEDDTIMAELLVGSSIILDLLKLIQVIQLIVFASVHYSNNLALFWHSEKTCASLFGGSHYNSQLNDLRIHGDRSYTYESWIVIRLKVFKVNHKTVEKTAICVTSMLMLYFLIFGRPEWMNMLLY